MRSDTARSAKPARSRASTRAMRRPERLAALLVLGLLAVLLILVNGGAWITLQRLHRMLERDLESRLITTGQTVAATLNAEDFLIFTFRDENGALNLSLIREWRDDASYTAILKLLERIKTAADLRSISIVLPDARVVADPDDIDVVGETRPLLFLDTPEMQEAARGKPAAGPLYPVNEVLYKRVYVPLFDDTGNVLALLRLEASSDYFVGLQRLRATLTALLIVSTVVLIVVSLVHYRLINRLLLTERAASQADRLRSLGTLAAGLAHEVRNPLAIIRLTCEELRSTLKPAAPADSGHGKPSTPAGETGKESWARRPSHKLAAVSPAASAAAPSASSPASLPPSTPLPSESAEDEGPAPLIRDIQEEVTRLEALVEQFLSFARPEASQSALTSGKPADPIVAVKNVTRLFEKSLRVTKVRLKTFLPPDPLPRVFLSEKGLSQALLNILRNAMEAMPSSGGSITVRVRERRGENPAGARKGEGAGKEPDGGGSPEGHPGEARSGEGLARGTDSVVEIVVEDDGPGMPESIRRQAFDPFFSTKENGTGLGLALVLRLVNSAGGDVELESKPGQGTTVRLLLPAAAPAQAVAPDSSGQRSGR